MKNSLQEKKTSYSSLMFQNYMWIHERIWENNQVESFYEKSSLVSTKLLTSSNCRQLNSEDLLSQDLFLGRWLLIEKSQSHTVGWAIVSPLSGRVNTLKLFIALDDSDLLGSEGRELLSYLLSALFITTKSDIISTFVITLHCTRSFCLMVGAKQESYGWLPMMLSYKKLRVNIEKLSIFSLFFGLKVNKGKKIYSL